MALSITLCSACTPHPALAAKKKNNKKKKKKKKKTSFGQPTSQIARGRACGSGVALARVCFAFVTLDRVLS